MRNRFILSIAAAIAGITLSFGARAQNTKPVSQAPDISGVWLVDPFQPRLFLKGSAPFTPWAEAKFKATNLQKDDPNLGCLPEGVPRFMLAVPYPMQIFETPTEILIIHEGVSVLRQIHMDREHLKDLDASYAGDSIGKWEGDTLVVDTIGFNDKTWLDGGGLPHSEALHVIERIRRSDHDTLVEDITVEDPVAYTKPLTAHETFKLKPGWEIREFVCEENNKYSYEAK